MRAPSSARMMSSIPARKAVPGATWLRAERKFLSVRGSARIEPRLNGLAQRLRFCQTHFATGFGAFRHDRGGKAQLRALGEPPVGLAGRPQAPCETDLAEAGAPVADTDSLGRRGDRERDPHVSSGLVDADAAGDVHEDVG